MKITINPFDEKSIAKAIKDLQEYKNSIKSKERIFLEKLAELGAENARAEFGMAVLDFTTDIQVYTEIEGNRAYIIAEGEQVAFVEFGAGVKLGYGYPGERPEGIVGIGEYGRGHGMNPNGWSYIGKDGEVHHSDGNRPASAMYDTVLVLAEKITEIAREVFSQHD